MLLMITLVMILMSTQIYSQGPHYRDGDIRLAGQNSNPYQGRVEIVHDSIWGTVCNDNFGTMEAGVVCKQLGHSDAGAHSTGMFGSGVGPIWLDNVQCLNGTTRLTNCMHVGYNQSNCNHTQDVGVICVPLTTPQPSTTPPIQNSTHVVPGHGNCTAPLPNIRLYGPANWPGVGVVQVLYNNIWVNVCDDDWDFNDAKVVCSMMCYDPADAMASSENFNTNSITERMLVNNVDCSGSESDFATCPRNYISCGRSEMAMVTCQKPWTNASAVVPQPTLSCDNGYLIATFSRLRNPDLRESHLAVNVSGVCNAIKSSVNTPYISVSIPFDECGTTKTYNSTHIKYSNVIQYQPTPTNGIVSTINTYNVYVHCDLPRHAFDQKPISIMTESVTQRAPGEYTVILHLFRNNSFVTPMTSYPLHTRVGEWLYVAVELVDIDSTLRLVVPDCYATPISNRNSSIRYDLFTDKCRVDQSVGFYPINNTWYGFRYETFKFVTPYNEVHIHCQAYICGREETQEECDRSCLTNTAGRRKKRTVDFQVIFISSPTIMMYDQDTATSSPVTTPRSDVVHTTRPTSTIERLTANDTLATNIDFNGNTTDATEGYIRHGRVGSLAIKIAIDFVVLFLCLLSKVM